MIVAVVMACPPSPRATGPGLFATYNPGERTVREIVVVIRVWTPSDRPAQFIGPLADVSGGYQRCSFRLREHRCPSINPE